MKKTNRGLSSIQEYNQFKTSIFDAFDEWTTFYDADPLYGIAVTSGAPRAIVCRREEAPSSEWTPLARLAAPGTPILPDAGAILDLADRFCFVY